MHLDTEVVSSDTKKDLIESGTYRKSNDGAKYCIIQKELEITNIKNRLKNIVVKPGIINLYTNLKDSSISHFAAFTVSL